MLKPAAVMISFVLLVTVGLVGCRGTTSKIQDATLDTGDGDAKSLYSVKRIRFADVERQLPTGHEVWLESGAVFYRTPTIPPTKIKSNLYPDHSAAGPLNMTYFSVDDKETREKYLVRREMLTSGGVTFTSTVYVGEYTDISKDEGRVDGFCSFTEKSRTTEACTVKFTILQNEPGKSSVDFKVKAVDLRKYQPDGLPHNFSLEGYTKDRSKWVLTCDRHGRFYFTGAPSHGEIKVAIVAKAVGSNTEEVREALPCEVSVDPSQNLLFNTIKKFQDDKTYSSARLVYKIYNSDYDIGLIK